MLLIDVFPPRANKVAVRCVERPSGVSVHDRSQHLFPALSQAGSVCQRRGTLNLLTWTITQMPTAFVQLPPRGGGVRRAFIAL